MSSSARAARWASTCRSIEQFYIYVKNALNGNFGTSVLTTNPVMTDIRRALPRHAELATLGTLIGSADRRAAWRAGGGQARQRSSTRSCASSA
jgi:hypothetical protein